MWTYLDVIIKQTKQGFMNIAIPKRSLVGITVTPDKEGDGLIVRTVAPDGAVARAGEPNVGDIIRRVNHDSAVGLGAAQGRSLIYNHSQYSSDVKYVETCVLTV